MRLLRRRARLPAEPMPMPLPTRIVFALLGLAAIAGAWWWRRLNAAALHWPATPGIVVESRVELDNENLKTLKLRYAYQVNGSTFECGRIDYHVLSRRLDEELLARYPKDAVVTVYVDPARPARAVLERGSSRSWAVAAGLGAALVAMAALAP